MEIQYKYLRNAPKLRFQRRGGRESRRLRKKYNCYTEKNIVIVLR